MKIIDKIVLSETVPNRNSMWIKTIKGKLQLYAWGNLGWQNVNTDEILLAGSTEEARELAQNNPDVVYITKEGAIISSDSEVFVNSYKTVLKEDTGDVILNIDEAGSSSSIFEYGTLDSLYLVNFTKLPKEVIINFTTSSTIDPESFLEVDNNYSHTGTLEFEADTKYTMSVIDGTITLASITDAARATNKPLKFINTGNSEGYVYIIGNNLQHNVTLYIYNNEGDGEWLTAVFGPDGYTNARYQCPANDYILIKGDNEYIASSTSDYLMITGDKDYPCDFKIEGSIMSLLGDYVREIPSNYCFANLFAGTTDGNKYSSLDVASLKLDAKKVMPYCYYQLFKYQSNLIDPIFPPNKVWEKSMCVSFLQGTGVEEYEIEFTANDLGQLQYFSADCANLTKAKIIAHGATTRQEFAYMFRNCNSLTEVILDCEDFDGQDVCKNMFQGVTSTGVLYVRPELVDNEVINAAIPETWRIKGFGEQPNNEIWYTTTTNETIDPSDFYVGVAVVSNEYDGKMCVMRFEEDIIDITALFDNDGREEDETQLLTVQIPETVEIIGDYTFYDCSSLTSITIPNRVTSIGNCTFQNCNDLTSVTIPSGVTSIGDEAFENCSSLSSVTIPNSVTDIGEGAFYECIGLTSITIPNSVTSIGNAAFSYCTNLTNIYFEGTISEFQIIEKGENWADNVPTQIVHCTDGDYNMSVENYKKIIYTSNNAQRVTPYNSNVFGANIISNNYNNGRGIILFDNVVTSIGNYAFLYCSGLTSITIPNSVTSIGKSAFSNCSGLTSVTIGNSVTSIGGYAFSGCSGLTSVTLPNSLIQLDNFIFCIDDMASEPGSLSTAIFEGTQAEFLSIAPQDDNHNGLFYGQPVEYIECTDGTVDASPYKQAGC